MKPGLQYSLFFAALGALFFLPFLGGVHLFDWDEINFAEIAREMVVMDDYLRIHVDYIPFNEKPPLFFWLQAASMHLFGIGEYAARFPNAICGILTLVLLFHMGRKLNGTRFGIIWAGAYFGSVLPHLYFKSGIIDPWFNLCIFLGIYLFVLYHWKRDQLKTETKFMGIQLPKSPLVYLFWGGFIIGIGILTKGPVAYLIAGLTFGVYWILQRFRMYVSIPHFLLFTVAALIVTGLWYGLETYAHGPKFATDFVIRQWDIFRRPDAGHAGFPGYHLVVNLIGCFPVSIIALRALWKFKMEDEHMANFRTWMIILLGVVLVLFTIVQSKIVHYSSMVYFPLTFLAALVVTQLLEGRIRFPKWMGWGLGFVGGLFVLATVAMPILSKRPELVKPIFEGNEFAQANLEAEVGFSGWEVLVGAFMLAMLVLFFLWVRKKQFERAFSILFGGTAVFVFLTLVFFIKKVEGYSQNAAMEFFKEKAGEDCYVITSGYKSYGQLFYTQKPQPTYSDELFNTWRDEDGELSGRMKGNWMINRDVDKDVYVITKVHKAKYLREKEQFEELGEKNGFVFFFRRKPSPAP